MEQIIRYLPSGDCALVMEFAEAIDPKVNRIVREKILLLAKHKIKGIREWVPAYRSILLLYNPSIISFHQLVAELQKLEEETLDLSQNAPRVVEIPTLYGGEHGPDLEYVASFHKISVEEAIKIHSEQEYLIYMLGFTPGFPYLGGMSEKIATPRLENPREKIPAGSVGIAANQTGIYPIESPGGWQLMGRTPVKLFDPTKQDPFLLNGGDYLRFVPISLEEYLEIESAVAQGQYKVKSTFRKEGDQLE